MRSGLCLFLAVTFNVAATAAPRLKDLPPKSQDIMGEWVCEERVIAGRPDPALRTQPIRFNLAAGRWVGQSPGQKALTATLDLDPTAKPAALTLYGPDDPDRLRSATLTGIYKLERDTLTICYVLGAGKRPSTFESKPGTEVRLMILRRAKDM